MLLIKYLSETTPGRRLVKLGSLGTLIGILAATLITFVERANHIVGLTCPLYGFCISGGFALVVMFQKCFLGDKIGEDEIEKLTSGCPVLVNCMGKERAPNLRYKAMAKVLDANPRSKLVMIQITQVLSCGKGLANALNVGHTETIHGGFLRFPSFVRLIRNRIYTAVYRLEH